MAYACPVCAEPQVDPAHLANHVAFTAITGDDAHEEWLEATVGEWGQMGQDELADVVVEHAAETAFPVADVEGHGGHEHGRDHDHSHEQEPQQERPRSVSADVDALDEDAAEVLAEAREMTREMHKDGAGEDGTGTTDESSDNETQ